MTLKEAKKALADNNIIQWNNEPDRWGYITCFDDDETGVYYKPKGMNGFRLFANLEDIETFKSKTLV